MSPILGIYASQISGHLFAPSGAYDSIATTTVGSGGSASISFTSIPSTYTHLQIRLLVLGNSFSNVEMRFNSDTGSNYSWHEIYGDGANPGASGYANTTIIRPVLGNSNTSYPAVGVIDILDYANTSKNKTTRSISGADSNGGADYIMLRSGNWRNTSAISTVTLTPQSGNFAQYSSFALYGIKGGN